MRTNRHYSFWLLASMLIPAGTLSAQEGAIADPLLNIASEMNVAANHLGRLRTGEPTQTAQQQAIKQIDQLIAELERQRDAGRGGQSGPNPTRPAPDSSIRRGPGGMGELHAERREGKQWAQLPAKERERILQSLNEGFPSHYQIILERYFARLADETPLAELIDESELEKPRAAATPEPKDKGTASGDKP